MAERVKVHLALVVAQFCFAGFDILCKLALSDGVSPVVFSFYRNAIAFILLATAAFVFERNNRPRLNIALLCQYFLLGTTGVFLNQVLYLLGMRATSAQFSSATQNTFPAFTFILAFLFRLETVNLNRRDGIAKVLGTILSVSGSMIMTFYKGPQLQKPDVYFHDSTDLGPMDLNAKSSMDTCSSLCFSIKGWQIGAIFLIGATLSVSIWLILQVAVLARYPTPMFCAAYTSFFGTIQLLMYAIFMERKPQNFFLKEGHEFIGVIYAGIFASGIYSFILTWANFKGGPVLVASYQPLETIFVSILGCFFSSEDLHMGSLLGAITVVVGLFVLTWGRGEEMRLFKLDIVSPQKVSMLRDPLLV